MNTPDPAPDALTKPARTPRLTPATILAVLAVLAFTIAAVGVSNPIAAGVEDKGGPAGTGTTVRTPAPAPADQVLGTIIQVRRHFRVLPHTQAQNKLLRCPPGTLLTGGGASLRGEPSRPASAPRIYTNGPVGGILRDRRQTWATEIANPSNETRIYFQYALCATTRIVP
jgi:hypothetical protein